MKHSNTLHILFAALMFPWAALQAGDGLDEITMQVIEPDELDSGEFYQRIVLPFNTGTLAREGGDDANRSLDGAEQVAEHQEQRREQGIMMEHEPASQLAGTEDTDLDSTGVEDMLGKGNESLLDSQADLKQDIEESAEDTQEHQEQIQLEVEEHNNPDVNEKNGELIDFPKAQLLPED